jgi:hypothetical protein
MAFSNVGLGAIAPGAANAQRWFFRFGGGINVGTQYITAHPITPPGAIPAGAELVVFDHSKKVEDDGTFTYFVSVRSNGPGIVIFRWEGGGVVYRQVLGSFKKIVTAC